MREVNTIFLTGYLARPPVVGTYGDGKPYCRFTLAVQGEHGTSYLPVVAWDDVAAALSQVGLQEGSRVFVEGSVRTRSFDGQGGRRHVTEVVAQKVLTLDGAPEVRTLLRPDSVGGPVGE